MPRDFDAQVIAAHGRHVIVRAGGTAWPARPLGRRLALVCGDRVRCRQDAQHRELHVIARLPRSTVLHRTSARGASEAIVANLDLLLVVVAPRPEADFFLVDRYLAAAESARLSALILLNKCDLEAGAQVETELAALERCGYPRFACSARQGNGLEALRNALGGHTAVLAGQSGVGKSSLVEALVPEATVATAELARTAQGRHTTSASRLYQLPCGGQLIDSPGVRDFAPAIEVLEPATLGFVEVARLAPGCRFLDCRHMEEPRCAVRAAVAGTQMHARRYESYRRLRRLYETLKAAQGPGRRP